MNADAPDVIGAAVQPAHGCESPERCRRILTAFRHPRDGRQAKLFTPGAEGLAGPVEPPDKRLLEPVFKDIVQDGPDLPEGCLHPFPAECGDNLLKAFKAAFEPAQMIVGMQQRL